MCAESRPVESKVTLLILRYLTKHPGAIDSLEGIVNWWIAREQIDLAWEQVNAALDDLVEKDFVNVWIFRNQKKLYGLNAAKQEEIQHLLEKITKSDASS